MQYIKYLLLFCCILIVSACLKFEMSEKEFQTRVFTTSISSLFLENMKNYYENKESNYLLMLGSISEVKIKEQYFVEHDLNDKASSLHVFMTDIETGIISDEDTVFAQQDLLFKYNLIIDSTKVYKIKLGGEASKDDSVQSSFKDYINKDITLNFTVTGVDTSSKSKYAPVFNRKAHVKLVLNEYGIVVREMDIE